MLAIDPGKTNMGVWVGTVSQVDGKIVPSTLFIDRMDMGSKVTMYAGAVDILGQVTSRFQISEAIVETQDPRNMPARIVACTVYGFLAGKGAAVEFSSSRLKNEAIETVALQYGVELLKKPTPQEIPDAKIRKRMMHSVNKKNSKAVVQKLVETLADQQVLQKLAENKKKMDDMTDALLLGIGYWLKKSHKSKKRLRSKVKCSP